LRSFVRRIPQSVLVGAIVALVSIVSVAGAASLITGGDIKNDSVTGKDVKNLKKKDLNKKLAAKIDQIGGNPHFSNPQWGIIDRNTEGSPVGALRGGPFAGGGLTPPLGSGSVELETADNTEKVAFGNETDFAGDPVSGLDQIGYQFFVTGEDLGRYLGNEPNITFEINPHVASKTYTSFVYVPPNRPTASLPAGAEWVNEDADANPGGTSGWYFSNGTVATATNCTQAHFCSLDEAQAALVAQNDGSGAATIGTVAVAKGKDYQFQGAVDALRINDTVYDFEQNGVLETTP
jgi:hypothetical protein